MYHGVSNQFEVLRVEDGMTTTVIKATGNIKRFTTLNSTTTDDVKEWEFTNMINSAAKTATKPTEKRKIKWVSPAIIKGKKGVSFRCGIVGHRVNKCIFLPARRSVATNGHCYSDDDSKNNHRKSLFRIGKTTTFDQNRGQKLKLSHGSLELKWGEFQKKKKEKRERATIYIISINK